MPCNTPGSFSSNWIPRDASRARNAWSTVPRSAWCAARAESHESRAALSRSPWHWMNGIPCTHTLAIATMRPTCVRNTSPEWRTASTASAKAVVASWVSWASYPLPTIRRYSPTTSLS
eukprot:2782222-Pyramimonas_sp.AAC.1